MPTRVKVWMELSARPNRAVIPGERLACVVRLHTNTPIRVQHWRARFVGECRCIPISTVALASASYPAHMAAIYDFYRNHQMIEYYHDSRTVTLHNHDCMFQNPLLLHQDLGPDLITTSTRQFEVTVPHPTPDTWAGSRKLSASVAYRVVAELRYQRLDKDNHRPNKERCRRTDVEVVVRNEVDVHCHQLHGVSTGSAEKAVGWGRFRGLVTCKLTLPVPAVVHGEHIPADVTILNQSSWTIRWASLTLYKEYTFTNSTAVAAQHQQPRWTDGVMEKVKVASIPLPSVGPGITWRRMVIGLRVVGECQTSHTFRHCSLLAIRFFVQLKVRWLVGSLKCECNVFVGTKRSENRPVLLSPATEVHFHPPDLQSTLTQPLPFRLVERALLPQRQLETVEEQKEEEQQEEEHDQGKREKQQKEQQLQQQQEQHNQQQQQQQLQQQHQTHSWNITTKHGVFSA